MRPAADTLRRGWRRSGAAALACLLHAAARSAAPPDDLSQLSLEQLREVVVLTVSRFEEPAERAAAAVDVITAEDIRRSGATTLPEALRLAPALDVARADANQYAISARGFNNVLANKMLVLIDGRTVYTPLFSGVFWEAQDVLLADVERIEVVSGPSTALWGSNAVNGMIHVITRAAGATLGPAAWADAGHRERGVAARWGMTLGADAHLRVHARRYERRDTERADGSSVNDRADGTHAGFRADWTRPGQRLTLQGEANEATIDQGPAPRHFSGAYLLARLERQSADGREASVQAYVERTRRDHPQTFFETLETADVVAQLGFHPAPGHRALVGLGLRHAHDDVRTFGALAIIPPSRSLTWRRLFAQDRVSLAPKLALTLAASAETNPYTGTEMLPSVRLAWQAMPHATAWSSLSRAVRAPSRVDREFFQPGTPPFLLAGGPGFRSEVSNVLELGWRAQPASTLSYAVTLFHHAHSRLRSLAPTPAGLQFQNGIEGRTRGLESTVQWRAGAHWRVHAGVTAMRQRLELAPGAVDVAGRASLGNDPRHVWTLRSALDLTPRHAWDVWLRHVGARPDPRVPAYTAVDTRLAWKPARGTEVALAVQNLLDARHPEWGVPTNRVELERSVMLQLRWQP